MRHTRGKSAVLVSAEGKVTVMAAADPGGLGPDLYQLLGVPREASRKDIAQAWRRRARAEHPDSRPGDAAAPGRFRALACAWHVLGDPARRAAYDEALAREHTPPSAPWPPELAVVTPAARMPGPPPLWAGPVRVETRPGHRGRAGRARRRSGSPCWPDWPCAISPGTGTSCGEPRVGGPGPGPVQHLGRRRAGRAAPADTADLRTRRTARPGPQRWRHPPLLPPRHRPAAGDLRTDRRRAEPGRHPPGLADARGDPPAAGRTHPPASTGQRPCSPPAADQDTQGRPDAGNGRTARPG